VAESIAVPAEERPLAALVLRTAGMAHLLVKKDQLAAAEFRGALAREPDDLEALNNLSFVLGENLHDPRAALPCAKRAVELLEMSEADLYSARAGDLYDTAGWIKSLAGEGDGALRDLHHSVECRPSAAAYLHLALAAQKAGPAHLGEACDAAARGLELAPGADPVRAALQELSEQLRAVPAAGTVRP
jgi:tetratricopeptide (TPR) repeat protein